MKVSLELDAEDAVVLGIALEGFTAAAVVASQHLAQTLGQQGGEAFDVTRIATQRIVDLAERVKDAEERATGRKQ